MLAKIEKTSWQPLENTEFLCSKNEQCLLQACDICHKTDCNRQTCAASIHLPADNAGDVAVFAERCATR